MRIATKTLITFLNKVLAGGVITDAKLSFETDGLHVDVADITKTGAISGTLSNSVFQDYTPMTANIKNTGLLLNILKSMNDIIDLSVDRNAFKIKSEGIGGELIMPQEEFLECNLKEAERLKLVGLMDSYGDGFVVDAALLDSSKKVSSMLGVKSVSVAVANGIFRIQSGEAAFDKMAVEIPVSYSDVAAVYGSTFLEFISVMKGSITVAFKNDFPIVMTSQDDTSRVRWLMSPIITEGE